MALRTQTVPSPSPSPSLSLGLTVCICAFGAADTQCRAGSTKQAKEPQLFNELLARVASSACEPGSRAGSTKPVGLACPRQARVHQYKQGLLIVQPNKQSVMTTSVMPGVSASTNRGC